MVMSLYVRIINLELFNSNSRPFTDSVPLSILIHATCLLWMVFNLQMCIYMGAGIAGMLTTANF